MNGASLIGAAATGVVIAAAIYLGGRYMARCIYSLVNDRKRRSSQG